MLGSLAIKLRILGYDTLYDKASSDSELIAVAKNSDRILLTSDLDLFLRTSRKGLRSVLVCEQSDKDRLVSVLAKSGVKKLPTSPESRCSVCNGVLEVSETKTHATATMICSSCGKIYWKGGHWKKLDALFREVRQSLSA
jgi:uncharacterized protein